MQGAGHVTLEEQLRESVRWSTLRACLGALLRADAQHAPLLALLELLWAPGAVPRQAQVAALEQALMVAEKENERLREHNVQLRRQLMRES